MPPIAPRIIKPNTLLCFQLTFLPYPIPKSSLPRRRLISAYGYTQAKALVFSKHGEPKDVLSCAAPLSFHITLLPTRLSLQHPLNDIANPFQRQPPHALSLPPSQNPLNPAYPRRPFKPRRHQPDPRPLSIHARFHYHPRHILSKRRPWQ